MCSELVSAHAAQLCIVMQGVDIPLISLPELGIEITAQPLGVSYSGSSNIRSDNTAIGMQSNLWCDLRLSGSPSSGLRLYPDCAQETAT